MNVDRNKQRMFMSRAVYQPDQLGKALSTNNRFEAGSENEIL